MPSEIRTLTPTALWNAFADLNAVPRASKKEERIVAFVQQFADKLGLAAQIDAVGNVLVRKPATPGMQNRQPIVLQSHLDMVHQKNAATDFDFDTQGIAMYIDQDWVKAKGTTLGADNGIGVATILAILASDTIAHPAIEALFTIDEETGMTGAKALDPNWLSGKILLNLDTEEDDEIGIGCAGGIDVTATMSYQSTETNTNHIAYQIRVKGLQGGHSGIDIHKGLGNANVILAQLLSESMQMCPVFLHLFEGGNLRNAIPRESVATVVLDKQNATVFIDCITKLGAGIQQELQDIEKTLSISCKQIDLPKQIMPNDLVQKLYTCLLKTHHGVFKMSQSVAGLVETSNNLAKVLVKDGKLEIACLTRSSNETSKQLLVDKLQANFESIGCEVVTDGDYPGWNPNLKSPILKVLEAVYYQINDKKPHVAACHAGLECGIIGQHYPQMDMISFGPTIRGAHSPDERVSIPSVQKFWKFILEILKNIPIEES